MINYSSKRYVKENTLPNCRVLFFSVVEYCLFFFNILWILTVYYIGFLQAHSQAAVIIPIKQVLCVQDYDPFSIAPPPVGFIAQLEELKACNKSTLLLRLCMKRLFRCFILLLNCSRVF